MKKSTLVVATLLTALSAVTVAPAAYADDDVQQQPTATPCAAESPTNAPCEGCAAANPDNES